VRRESSAAEGGRPGEFEQKQRDREIRNEVSCKTLVGKTNEEKKEEGSIEIR